MAKIHDLFKVMLEYGASDLHISSGTSPYFRIDGEMRAVNTGALEEDQVKSLIGDLLNEKQKKRFSENWELDCSIHAENIGRFRCNVFMQKNGLGAVFRAIPEVVPKFDHLGLPPIFKEFTKIDRGLVLVTGPTGSGKSTTLAAMIDLINEEQRKHILTIEDPIEFVHQTKNSLINQRELASHTQTFPNALKAALREDPDVILVGELRDIETIQLAITAAETGHLVFGTLHTQSTSKTLDRIIDVFPGDKREQIRTMLSESLHAIVAQTLFKKRAGKGRIPAFEILINNRAISNLIRENKTHQIPSILQTNINSGMCTFEKSINELIDKNLIDEKSASAFIKGLQSMNAGLSAA